MLTVCNCDKCAATPFSTLRGFPAKLFPLSKAATRNEGRGHIAVSRVATGIVPPGRRGEDSEGERMVFGSGARRRRIGFFIHWLLNDSHLSLSLVVRRVEIIPDSKCNRTISPLCFKDSRSSSGWRKKLFFGICEVFQPSGTSLCIRAFLIKNKC